MGSQQTHLTTAQLRGITDQKKFEDLRRHDQRPLSALAQSLVTKRGLQDPSTR